MEKVHLLWAGARELSSSWLLATCGSLFSSWFLRLPFRFFRCHLWSILGFNISIINLILRVVLIVVIVNMTTPFLCTSQISKIQQMFVTNFGDHFTMVQEKLSIVVQFSSRFLLKCNQMLSEFHRLFSHIILKILPNAENRKKLAKRMDKS